MNSEVFVRTYSFYTLIPAKGTLPDRTFLILPPSATLRAHFSPAPDTLASDEIHAHMDMFDKSDGLYQLAQETAALVQDWVDQARQGRMGYWRGEATDPTCPNSVGKERVV